MKRFGVQQFSQTVRKSLIHDKFAPSKFLAITIMVLAEYNNDVAISYHSANEPYQSTVFLHSLSQN